MGYVAVYSAGARARLALAAHSLTVSIK